MGRASWSAASLARPIAVGTVSRNVPPFAGTKPRYANAYRDVHLFLSALFVVTRIKTWGATPDGLASEAALHG